VGGGVDSVNPAFHQAFRGHDPSGGAAAAWLRLFLRIFEIPLAERGGWGILRQVSWAGNLPLVRSIQNGAIAPSKTNKSTNIENNTMKTNTKQLRPGFTLVELLVVIVIIAALAGLTAPQLIRMRKKGDQVVAMNNGKQMVLALTDFSTEYGNFPDKDTAKDVTNNTGSSLNLSGDTANDYFRQLIAAGVAKSEEPFYSKTPYSTKKPDNDTNGANALEAGEVGFGYIMNGMNGTTAIPNDDPNRIIACTPLLNATTKGEFDAGPLDNKAALVYLDQSVKMLAIREDNKKVAVSGGKTLLDTGDTTLWGPDIKPVIKAPKKK
jgi:prepilin-type N-terminal cleavage/methylation domain-containing protein